jgi:pimeloyl-ACP methyl ester carboxylesterase
MATIKDAQSLLTTVPKLVGSILRLRGTFTAPIGTPNGIAELQQVELNGYPQWVLIRGHDVSDPLFLFLHGGPGESNLWLAHHTMKELERHFVCVNWDQRGAGKSLLPGPDPSSMTIEQLYEDTVDLIKLLLARFEKEKLLLLGHSWGGLLATKVAARHPELLHAVILMNPMIDNRRGEDISYRWVLERARTANDDKAVRVLEKLGSSDTYGKEGRFIERIMVLRYGGLVHSVGLQTMVRLMLEAPEYSIAECIRNFRMKSLSFSIPLMADELMDVNLIKEVPQLAVPVFLFLGRHDHTAPSELSQEFYGSLQAPHKEVIWFEESAHTPDLDEPEKFQREVIRIGKAFYRREMLAAAGGSSGPTEARPFR